jgi:hypothetical protein
MRNSSRAANFIMISESKTPQTFAEKIDEMIGRRLARQLQRQLSTHLFRFLGNHQSPLVISISFDLKTSGGTSDLVPNSLR